MSLQTGTPVPAATAPAFRPFAVRVSALRRLSPSFLRITLYGDDLDEMACGGADQRVKLLLPLPGQQRPVLPPGEDWHAQWRSLPTERRFPMRTYTVRAARPLQREVDVDVVLHGATGPASAWAQSAAPGDEVLLVGPNARFAGQAGGVEWRPPAGARALLLVGDETAVPAISAIAESLPPGTGARVLLEVPDEADVLPVQAPADVQITWLPRRTAGAQHPHGARLDSALRRATRDLAVAAAPEPADDPDPDELVWEVPAGAAGGAYVWMAGEAGVVTQLRRHLLREVGLDRRSVAFMGYWRQGRTEAG